MRLVKDGENWCKLQKKLKNLGYTFQEAQPCHSSSKTFVKLWHDKVTNQFWNMHNPLVNRASILSMWKNLSQLKYTMYSCWLTENEVTNIQHWEFSTVCQQINCFISNKATTLPLPNKHL